jgi:predicted phage gp36 major capsid-like protein
MPSCLASVREALARFGVRAIESYAAHVLPAVAIAALGHGVRAGGRCKDDGGHMAIPGMIRKIWDTLGEYPAEVIGFAIVQLLLAAYGLVVL